MDKSQQLSLRLDVAMDKSHSSQEIRLRRCFLRYMNALYSMAFSRLSAPRIHITVGGTTMEGFNPLRFSPEEDDQPVDDNALISNTDVDITFVLRDVTAEEYVLKSASEQEGRPGTLMLQHVREYPGYVKLYADSCDVAFMDDEYSFLGPAKLYTVPDADLFVISSDALCKEFYKYLETGGYANIYTFSKYFPKLTGIRNEDSGKACRHGPSTENPILSLFGIASETRITEYDVRPAICIEEWPSVADGWQNRRRHWPDQKLTEQILSCICHVVAAGNPGSRESKLEWRLSFSCAEQKLLQSWNDTQQKCYVLLQMICAEKLPGSKILSTYHLKTIMMWACEKRDPSVWRPENLIECVRQVLVDLKQSCASRDCPHYFVDGNNLFLHADPVHLKSAEDGLDAVFQDFQSVTSKCLALFDLQKGKAEVPQVQSETNGNLSSWQQQLMGDWDTVTEHVVIRTKEQLSTEDLDKTISKYEEELDKCKAGEKDSETSSTSNVQFLTVTYKYIVLENLGWLYLAKAVRNREHPREGSNFKLAGKFLFQAAEYGELTALVKYAYYKYILQDYITARKICREVIRGRNTSTTSSPLYAENSKDGGLSEEQLRDHLAARRGTTDVVFFGDDSYALDEPMRSLVASAPHFFALHPKSFSYITLAMCYRAEGDENGVKLTLKEYSWFARSHGTQVQKGKEMVTIAVLYHFFGYIPEAIRCSQEAAIFNKRFQPVMRHIQALGRSSFMSGILDLFRGVFGSVFAAHTLHYIGVEIGIGFVE